MSVHIESNKDDIAETVLMPGDPKRCEYIARKFLANAKLINNVRGMTGYTGYYKSKKITVFPSGMGNPSMGIYSYELFKEYDVNNIIRIGTMGAYTNLNLKDIVLVTNSVTNSNYGKFLCNYPNININGSIELNSAIESTAATLNIKVNNSTNNKHEDISLKNIFKDKILNLFSLYILIGTIAMSTALGLKMLTLTNYFKFSDNVATNYLLIVGLLADIFGIIALKYLTPKNDYITITIKFGIRFFAYVIAFISNNIVISLIAITWSIFISTSYENICDAVYINRLENKYQLSFSNICHIIRFLGEAIGVYLCGLMYEIGLRYMLGLSALLMIFQISLAYYLIYLRKREKINIEVNKNEKIRN